MCLGLAALLHKRGEKVFKALGWDLAAEFHHLSDAAHSGSNYLEVILGVLDTKAGVREDDERRQAFRRLWVSMSAENKKTSASSQLRSPHPRLLQGHPLAAGEGRRMLARLDVRHDKLSGFAEASFFAEEESESARAGRCRPPEDQAMERSSWGVAAVGRRTSCSRQT